jgi:hypothetical protein
VQSSEFKLSTSENIVIERVLDGVTLDLSLSRIKGELIKEKRKDQRPEKTNLVHEGRKVKSVMESSRK